MSDLRINRNMGLDLVRTTEAAALSAARWMGLGQPDQADHAAASAMARAFDTLDIDGMIVIGEEGRSGERAELCSGRRIGRGNGPLVDIVADPIDGRRILAQGRSGALAVAALAPRGAMWSPAPAVYMEKLVVNKHVAPAIVPQCLDAPVAWTLAIVARAKSKRVRDLVVFVLDRPRHADLINELYTAGARVMLQNDGDIAGALQAASPDGTVDVMIGIGGAPEGVIAACAVRAMGGAMLARLAPQTEAERAAIQASGLDLRRILTEHEMVSSDQVFFSVTGITDGPLLHGVRFHEDRARTYSLVLRGETGIRRTIYAEHMIEDDEIAP